MPTRSRSPKPSTEPSSPVRQFRRLADAWLKETCARYPEYASSIGLPGSEALLSKNSAGEHLAHLSMISKTVRAVESLPEAAFTGDDYLDRRAFLAMLRTQELLDGKLGRWRNNPQTSIGTAIDAIFERVTRNSSRIRNALPSIESRLDAIPRFLKSGVANLRRPVPLWTSLAAKSCAGGIEFLEALRDELCSASDDPDRTASKIQNACDAIGAYSRSIQSMPPGERNGFSIGREAFEILIRERLGMDQSLPELEANGWMLIASLKSELADEARRLGYANPEDALAAGRKLWTPDRPLIDVYRETTHRIKEQLADLDLVTMPNGESLDVTPVPAFLRDQFPTAAYHAPPPFSKRQVGIFWVNDLSLGTNDRVAKMNEIRQHYGVEFTTAHEAYPGHHLQFAIQNQHPSKLRRLFAHAIFYEGWTLWCEKMCVDQEIVRQPDARLIQLHDALWRAYRIVIDCGLHSGKLTYRAACNLLVDGVGFTRARAEGDVNWYTSSPTVPMSYLLGRLEVERLHRRFVGAENWTLKQFNDWMLSHGALPWRWILEAQTRGFPSPR